ncbi:MAG: DUF2845 domain-containing protein [Thiopseudomonas sp.]|nr:DUF2845 domain-containing protein [Denitrificimonas caeni]MBP7188598.1 DUF2845 domain-containing protein [Thiopseudomonas sp.]HAB91907.1 DUF2845 domain-containing protein [Pseudomonas sp.]MBP8007641.1 DUF2845 domain-containing protein [Thiopseudomonas sp.]MBP9614249.1 DUF2845 domain-containing protein [Thiopseudomonas sp.]HHX06645.1 DUF2845 domain-containing protein [Pseudomonas sp.]
MFANATLALLLLGFAVPAQASSTFRCNSKLVSLQASTHEVQSKCGAPMEQAHLGYKQLTNEYGHTHEVGIEEWVYGPKGGMYYFLRFEGGYLSKISSSR